MQRLLVLFLTFVCATANAQIYRRIGPDGHVYFSDRPGPDAEQIEVTPNTAVRLPPVPGGGDAAKQQNAAAPAYSSFSIVSPSSNQGVRANNGNVTVVLKLVPDLQSGHTIRLGIDGEDGAQISAGESLTIELTNLSRGLHTVTATVLDQEGSKLIQAGPVSFNVLRVAVGN
jgi:Domain of unknown function (DUF4124)